MANSVKIRRGFKKGRSQRMPPFVGKRVDHILVAKIIPHHSKGIINNYLS